MTNGRLRFLAVLLALLFHAPALLAAEPLRVELEATAAALPEGDIRVAVEKELGRPVTGPDPALPSDVSVGVAEGKLVIRVRQGNNVVERSVPLPQNLGDVPLTVSLIVGNLARDQSVGLAAPAEAAPAPTTAPEAGPRAAGPPAHSSGKPDKPHLASFPDEPAYRKHLVGVHFAQDLAYVGGNNVCDPNLGQKSSNFACFYDGTSDEPFMHTPFPHRDTIQDGWVVATRRILLSYEHAFFPFLSLGARAGFAFNGGPPAGQQVDRVEGEIPERAKGSEGVPFMPVHLELKVAYWFAPRTNRLLRAYVQASAGTAQVDAKVSVPEYDCTHAGNPELRPEETAGQSMSWTDPSSGRVLSPFEQCKAGAGYYDYRYYEPTKVDAWKKMGQVFLSLGAGGMLAISDQLGVVLNLNGMLMLPASGVVLQPSLGMEYAF